MLSWCLMFPDSQRMFHKTIFTENDLQRKYSNEDTKLGNAECYLLKTHNNIEEHMKGSKKFGVR